MKGSTKGAIPVQTSSLSLLSDIEYMELALRLAERGRGRTSPNPMVGAVVVTPEGVVAGTGFHERAGRPHAEVHALAAAGRLSKGATLYCNLEPCCHSGRTGPCVERITSAGVARVVAAVEDPNPLVAGKGLQFLEKSGVAVQVGVGRLESIRLNRAFFTYMLKRRPFVIIKAAISVDGKIASAPGCRTEISSAPARRRVQALRAEVDAIAVGSETVLADDPLLTARDVYRERPLIRIVLDRRLRTPPTARLFSSLSAGPVLLVTSTAAARSARAEVLKAAGAMVEPVDEGIAGVVSMLARKYLVTSLLIEGGSALHEAAWRAGIVDFVQLYVAPTTIGESGLAWFASHEELFAGLSDVRIEQVGPDVLMEGYVHGID
jgi:diaminohydroxyphosphoribosylaminopyrimidine deaminase / 5-amino-6-(5-phosphoribosylamino)uracil reductase